MTLDSPSNTLDKLVDEIFGSRNFYKLNNYARSLTLFTATCEDDTLHSEPQSNQLAIIASGTLKGSMHIQVKVY